MFSEHLSRPSTEDRHKDLEKCLNMQDERLSGTGRLSVKEVFEWRLSEPNQS